MTKSMCMLLKSLRCSLPTNCEIGCSSYFYLRTYSTKCSLCDTEKHDFYGIRSAESTQESSLASDISEAELRNKFSYLNGLDNRKPTIIKLNYGYIRIDKPKNSRQGENTSVPDISALRLGASTTSHKYKTELNNYQNISVRSYSTGTTRKSIHIRRSAFEAVKELRSRNPFSFSEQEDSHKLDSKGFRNLKFQVENIDYLTTPVLLDKLKQSVVYSDDNFLALNKPYGLACHIGPKMTHCISHLLPDLSKLTSSTPGAMLYLTHRLDKTTTGTLLLARQKDVARQVSDMFAKGLVRKKYLAITRGVPRPVEGIIDIPICEEVTNNIAKMALAPDRTDETSLVLKRRTSPRCQAITKYKVIDTYGSAAIVELSGLTGVKHQLRIHLSHGLNCPVLGDHKYSNFSKLAPQKLPPDMLQRLHIRQPTTRHVRMHLHAWSLVLPEFYNGRNVRISSKLPDYFRDNLRALGLKLPPFYRRPLTTSSSGFR